MMAPARVVPLEGRIQKGGTSMNRTILAAAATAVLVLGVSASAQHQPDFSQVQIKTTDLGNRTYMLEGQGGNITVAVGDDGIIMVDGEFAPLHDKIKAAITAVSKQPIKYLVNTHFHGDHTGGNEPFGKDGAIVVAHQNVKTRLAEGTTNGLNGTKTPPVPAAALPAQVYTDALTLQVKGRTAQLKHIANAHTDGDTYVYFTDANVLATGDIVTFQRYPNIDFANGGNVKGVLAGVDTYLKLANDNTKIVPGHGALGTKADLMAYRTLIQTARDRVAKLIADGKSEADAVAAKPLAELDAKVGANEMASANFVRVIYNSLKPKQG
jgi:glyoxylase-like metal-dependent hydrolase (beta-lactamase superfamily II)